MIKVMVQVLATEANLQEAVQYLESRGFKRDRSVMPVRAETLNIGAEDLESYTVVFFCEEHLLDSSNPYIVGIDRVKGA